MKTTLLSAATLVGLAGLAQAQTLASDDFSYSGALTSNGWSAHSGAGNKEINANGSFATLDQSGGSGEDINLPFTPQSDTATTYASCRFRVNSTGADLSFLDGSGLYFFHLKDSGFAFRARTGIVNPSGGGDFGLAINGDNSNLGAGTTWAGDLSFDTWYTVVVSWNASTGEGTLWLDPCTSSDTSIAHTGTNTGDEMEQVALRQSNDLTAMIDVDDVRAGTDFDSVTELSASFDGDVGAGLLVGDDTISTVTLGFAFPWPDGSSTTQVDVDSNGRIFQAGSGDTSDFTETVGELLAEASPICAYWDDLSPQINGDVFFRTTADIAVFTWVDTVRFNGTTQFSFQIQLYPDGTINLCYDDRVDLANDALVGISAGGGAADPGESDLSALAGLIGTTAYEVFGSGEFDLLDGCIQFRPSGGGYCVSSNFPPAPIPGFVTRLEKPSDITLDFSPDGSGGYNVSKIPASFVDDSGLSPIDMVPLLVNGSVDDGLTSPLVLGHSFVGPGGSAWTSVSVDNNGVVHGNAAETSGDFNASVGDLTGGDSKIAAFWCDLSAQLGAGFRFATTATQTVITWDQVPQFAETNAMTFQVVLNDDDSFQINFKDTSQWRTGSGFTSDDVIIGCSEGGGAADPGEVDYASYPIASVGGATIYEFWDATFPSEVPTIQARILSTSTPTLGGTLDVSIEGISSSATMEQLLLGFSNPNIDLGAIPALGLPGSFLLSSNDVNIVLTPVGGIDTYSLALPLNPGFVGLLDIYLQGAYFAGENTGGVILTEGLNIFF